MTNTDLGPRKTVFIMVIVVGCFAVLWPKVFYPMYTGTMYSMHTKSQDKSAGCCDVIWETDVNAIKIMIDLCGNILKNLRDTDPRVNLAFENGKLTNDIIDKCRLKVISTCNVDIALFLRENVLLGRTYRQMLDELRSTNSSLCLKYNFGVTPDALGVRHQITIDSNKILNVRQERPAHLHPDLLHPALRERGRAIPSMVSTGSSIPSTVHHQAPPRVLPGRPGPIPGMRPTIGGAGHIVPPPKTSTSTMGIVMPIYTIGIVIFFTYTLMKIMFKKEDKSNVIYPAIKPDPLFHRRVFNKEYSPTDQLKYYKRDDLPSSKLVVTALTDMLTEVDQRREALAKQRVAEAQYHDSTIATTTTVTDPEHQNTTFKHTSLDTDDDINSDSSNIKINGDATNISTKLKENKELIEEINEENNQDVKLLQSDKIPIEENATIKVVGMEVVESCEGGKPWSRPSSPIVPPLHLESHSPEPPPLSIMLEGKVPAESQILITDQEIIEQNTDDEESLEPTIMLSGKITLSVIPSEKTDNESENSDQEISGQNYNKSKIQNENVEEINLKESDIESEKDEDLEENSDNDIHKIEKQNKNYKTEDSDDKYIEDRGVIEEIEEIEDVEEIEEIEEVEEIEEDEEIEENEYKEEVEEIDDEIEKIDEKVKEIRDDSNDNIESTEVKCKDNENYKNELEQEQIVKEDKTFDN